MPNWALLRKVVMVILRLQVSVAFDIALDLSEALVRSVANPSALLTQVPDGYLGDCGLSLWTAWSDKYKALDTDLG